MLLPSRPRCLIVLLSLLAIGSGPAAPADSIVVNIVGTLKSGLMAIGGETTGTTITAHDITWELDFGRDAALRQAAEQLDGQPVRVTGSLTRRAGVEIRERWIVTVTSLRAPDAPAGPTIEVEPSDRRDDARIRLLPEADADLAVVVVDIRSPSGIGAATLRKKHGAPAWPATIMVRLHLKGLESFQATTAHGASVEWSVSSNSSNSTHDSPPTRVSLRREDTGEATPIGPDSPYHTRLNLIDGGEGFEVPLPDRLFEGEPEAITLRWIDFYR